MWRSGITGVAVARRRSARRQHLAQAAGESRTAPANTPWTLRPNGCTGGPRLLPPAAIGDQVSMMTASHIDYGTVRRAAVAPEAKVVREAKLVPEAKVILIRSITEQKMLWTSPQQTSNRRALVRLGCCPRRSCSHRRSTRTRMAPMMGSCLVARETSAGSLRLSGAMTVPRAAPRAAPASSPASSHEGVRR